MELEEHWRHATRRELIKVVRHISSARIDLTNAVPHIKLIGQHAPQAIAIEENIDALTEGINETLKMCADYAETIKKAMTHPNAKPAPEQVNTRIVLTPFQRRLQREGTEFQTIAIFQKPTSNTEEKMPNILPFHLHKKKQKNRRATKDNPPL